MYQVTDKSGLVAMVNPQTTMAELHRYGFKDIRQVVNKDGHPLVKPEPPVLGCVAMVK